MKPNIKSKTLKNGLKTYISGIYPKILRIFNSYWEILRIFDFTKFVGKNRGIFETDLEVKIFEQDVESSARNQINFSQFWVKS